MVATVLPASFIHRRSRRVPLANVPCRLDAMRVSEALGCALSPRLADLLDIAKSLYAADRLAKRDRRSTLRGQTRSMDINVIVRDPLFWSSRSVRQTLERAIQIVSDDEINITFTSGTCNEAETLIFPSPPLPLEKPHVYLYSGGLDSLAGLVGRLRESQQPVLTVTARHQVTQRKLVQHQLGIVRAHFGVRIDPLLVKVALVDPPAMNHQELTQRWRSFLFLSLGATAACLANTDVVEVFESGVGAVNLPLMAGMLVGARTTRGCHPRFLATMAELVSLAANRAIKFHLPFAHRTKGEMACGLVQAGLGAIAKDSVSCAHYPLRESEMIFAADPDGLWPEVPLAMQRSTHLPKQCGICPACIGRRQALFVAGIIEPAGTYKHDLFSTTTPEITDDEWAYVKATLMQIELLGHLIADQPLPPLVARHLYGSGILEAGARPDAIVDLLQRYRQEWLGLLRHGRSQGWAWCQWLPE